MPGARVFFFQRLVESSQSTNRGPNFQFFQRKNKQQKVSNNKLHIHLALLHSSLPINNSINDGSQNVTWPLLTQDRPLLKKNL